MLQLHVQTTLPLARPTGDQGLVTWLDIDAQDRDPATGEVTRIAQARVAIIHVAAMFSVGCNVEEVLSAEGLGPEALEVLPDCIEVHDYLFGLDLSDLLYLARFKLEGGRPPANLDLAIVQLVHDTLAHACALVVVPFVKDDHERWEQAGFEPEQCSYDPSYLSWDTRECQDRIEIAA